MTAPESLPVEIPNTLSSKFKQGALELHEALEGIQRFEAIPVQQVPINLGEATRLPHELGIYARDAYMTLFSREAPNS